MKSRKVRLSREEREVQFNKTAADDHFQAYVTDPTWKRRLISKGWTPHQQDAVASQFSLPVNFLSIRSRAAVDNSSSRGNPASLKKARAQRKGPGRDRNDG